MRRFEGSDRNLSYLMKRLGWYQNLNHQTSARRKKRNHHSSQLPDLFF